MSKNINVLKIKNRGFTHYSACFINFLIKNNKISLKDVEKIEAFKWNYSIRDIDDLMDFLEAVDNNYIDYDILKIIIDNDLSSAYIKEGESAGGYLTDLDYLIDEIRDTYYNELDQLPDFITNAIDWEEVAEALAADYTEIDGVYFYDYI